jgi:hypothetical protein
MSLLTGSRHYADEDLLRYMDHQLDREAMRLTGVHLRTCEACAGRLEEMRKRADAVRSLLEQLPGQEPDPNRRAVALAALDRARFRGPAGGPRWLRAAAAVTLMIGGGLATEPGRAFVAQGIVRTAGSEPGDLGTRLVRWLGQDGQLRRRELTRAPNVAVAPVERPSPSAGAAGPAPAREHAPARARIKPGMSAPVRFTPAGPDVTLVFSAIQAHGTATLWIRNTPNALAQAVSGFHGEAMTPTASGLEVRNAPESTADYMLTIPTRYRFIRVRVGDGPEVLVPISKSKREWIWTINLQSSAL